MLTLIQKLAHLCLKPLIALFDFPIVPAELTTLVNKLFEYIQAGTGILNFFVPFDVIRPAIDVFLAVWAVISIHALLAESDSKSAQNSGALLRIWNKFYGDFIFMLTGKAVFYPFCPCFFHIFWCEGTGNFMIAFPSH